MIIIPDDATEAERLFLYNSPEHKFAKYRTGIVCLCPRCKKEYKLAKISGVVLDEYGRRAQGKDLCYECSIYYVVNAKIPAKDIDLILSGELSPLEVEFQTGEKFVHPRSMRTKKWKGMKKYFMNRAFRKYVYWKGNRNE